MIDDKHNHKDIVTIKDLINKTRNTLVYLQTKKVPIMVMGILGALIGFSYAFLKPTKYAAKSTFIIEDVKSPSSNLGGLASLAGQLGVDVNGVNGNGLLSIDNILLYFKSQSLAREVLLSSLDSSGNESFADAYASLYGLKNQWINNEKIGKINFPPLIKNITYTRLQDSLIQKISEQIIKNEFVSTRPDKKASFIDVIVTMRDEGLSKMYCERIVETVVNRYINTKIQRQKITVEKLQNRADSIAALLRQKTASSASLQNNTSTMDINPLFRTNTNVAVETTMRDKTLLSTIFASVTQNLEIAKFTLSQETPVIQMIDTPFLPLKREKPSKIIYAVLISMLTSVTTISYFLIKKVIHNLNK